MVLGVLGRGDQASGGREAGSPVQTIVLRGWASPAQPKLLLFDKLERVLDVIFKANQLVSSVVQYYSMGQRK